MLLTDYLSLIPPINHDQPRFTAFLSAILSQVKDLDDLRESFLSSFSLDTAEGTQLDIIGHLVGASRILPFEPANASRKLSDTNFRLLIRATILRAHWSGTPESYPAFVSALFPDNTVTVSDNMDMSVTISAPRTLLAAVKEMLSHGMLIPVPLGVSLSCDFT